MGHFSKDAEARRVASVSNRHLKTQQQLQVILLLQQACNSDPCIYRSLVQHGSYLTKSCIAMVANTSGLPFSVLGHTGCNFRQQHLHSLAILVICTPSHQEIKHTPQVCCQLTKAQ